MKRSFTMVRVSPHNLSTTNHEAKTTPLVVLDFEIFYSCPCVPFKDP